MGNLIFYTKPWKHQLQAIEYLMPRRFGALYTDMGSGKTKIMLDLIVNKGFKTTLILGTKRGCSVWDTEFKKHIKNNNFGLIDLSKLPGDKKSTHLLERVTTLNFEHVIIVNNYDSVWRRPFKDFLLRYPIDCVICDESHRIKGAGSKVSRFLGLLGRRTPYRYIVTGTLMAQTPLDVYGQYRFLEPTLFGTNHENFLDRYANRIIAPEGYKYINRYNPYKNLDDLYTKVFSCAFTANSELDLPETQDIEWYFDMPTKSLKYYKELVKESCLELETGNVTAQNALTMLIRLQQLSSGYLPTDNGVEQIDNARQTAFMEWLEELPIDEPVVVFCKFVKDIKDVRQAVESMGRTVSEVSGRIDTLEAWQNGKTDVLVVQISSGAESLDFTRAKYAMYYSLSQELWKYQQSRKRLHRPGQKRPVIFYHLLSKAPRMRTVDEKLLEGLRSNRNIIDDIMQQKFL